jgi:hypothetical protein
VGHAPWNFKVRKYGWGQMLCAALLLYDKLSSRRPSNMSTPSIRHVWGTKFSSIRRGPEYIFIPLFIFLSPPVGGDPNDSAVIYFLLLPTCKIREGNSSRHRIGPLPIGFVPPLRHHGNSLVFNLVFSFPSFFCIASQFFWSRYSYDALEHHSINCIWVHNRFTIDHYSRVSS